MLAGHADWSIDPRKRWVTLAQRGAGGWQAQGPALVGDPLRLTQRLLGSGQAAVLGLDLPLGLPRAHAALQLEADFPRFLAHAPERPEFFRVNTDLTTVSTACPFYPQRGVKGMTRAAHAAALGMGSAQQLSRLCDRATASRPAGAPVFWTLGANQSGKAAITAWRDWLGPALAAGLPLALWPFAGPLAALLKPGRLVLAETYPAEAMRHLGLKMQGSKRRHADRVALAPALRACMAERRVRAEPSLENAINTGFGADAAGEDRFDSLLGLLCVISVVEGLRADFIPADPWVRHWEGWVLGQSDMPRDVSPGTLSTFSLPQPPL